MIESCEGPVLTIIKRDDVELLINKLSFKCVFKEINKIIDVVKGEKNMREIMIGDEDMGFIFSRNDNNDVVNISIIKNKEKIITHNFNVEDLVIALKFISNN